MSEHQEGFRELDVREVLSDEDYFVVHSPRAYRHIRSNEDLFHSHFCDDDYYQPVKKKSRCFDQETSIRTHRQNTEENAPNMKKKQRRPQKNEADQNRSELTKLVNAAKIGIKVKPKLTISTQNLSFERTNGFNAAQTHISVSIPLKSMPKEKSQSLPAVMIVLINSKYYIRYKSAVVEANQSNLRCIYNSFIKQQLWVPLCPPHSSPQCSHGDSLKLEEEEAQRLFTCSLGKYFAYLHSHFPLQLQAILDNFKATLEKGARMTQLITGAIDTIKNYFRCSRTDSLRKTLLSKWRTLRQARRQAAKWGEEIASELEKEEEGVWARMGEMELLWCLQETERHCGKKVEESSGQLREYWSAYRSKMKADMEKHLTAISEMII